MTGPAIDATQLTAPKSLTMDRAMLIACSSSRARWSVTPLSLECIRPPPRVSSSTTSPVAARTCKAVW